MNIYEIIGIIIVTTFYELLILTAGLVGLMLIAKVIDKFFF